MKGKEERSVAWRQGRRAVAFVLGACLGPTLLSDAARGAQAVGPGLPRWQLDVSASGSTHLHLLSEAFGDDLAVGGFAHLFDQVQVLTPGVFAVNPLVGGTSYGAALHSLAWDGVAGVHEAYGFSVPRLLVYGLETDTFTLVWVNYSSTYARTDGHAAWAVTNTPFELDFYLENLPPSQPVRFFTQYYLYSRVRTAHETDGMLPVNPFEDPVHVVSANLYLDAQNMTGDRFDLDGTLGHLSAQREYLSPVLVESTTAGSRKLIGVTGETFAQIASLGIPDGYFERDDSHALWFGVVRVKFDLGSGAIPDSLFEPQGPGGLITYSLDIGSDCELSDPRMDGNEAFDPGDVYVFGAQNPAPGMNGPWNDAMLTVNGFDPLPASPAGSTPPAPVCTPGPPVVPLFMDLDGHHLSESDLRSLIGPAPLDASIARFASDSIFDGWHLVVSFDDDGTLPHNECDIPIHAPSPSGATHGTTAGRDEAIALEVDAFSIPAAVLHSGPLWDEIAFSPDLAPNPDLLPGHDDDVDALCTVDLDPNSCPWLYFSVDHEARSYEDPTNPSFQYWDPATIYVGQNGQGCTPQPATAVILGSVHLGLPAGTDVDAFSFAWVWDAVQNRDGLALLFSVDEDDPTTPDDESGGLDPRMIYVSFFTGSSQPYLDQPLQDDVDALGVWKQRLRQVPPDPFPSFCDGPSGVHALCPCGASVAIAGCNTQTGAGVRLDVLLQDTLLGAATLQGTGYPPATSPTAIVIRANNLPAQPVLFGDGLRCIGLTGFARLGATNAVLGASTHAIGHSTAPGTFFYQLWFRNGGASFCITTGPSGGVFNLSNGRTVNW